MWRVVLLLCVGCDRLFALAHLPDAKPDVMIDAAPPDAPPICFADMFESGAIDFSHWTSYAAPPASVAESNGALEITIGTTVAYAGVQTAAFDLRDGAIQVDLVQPPDEGGGEEAGLQLGDDNNAYAIYTTNGNIFFRQLGSGANDQSMLAFDPSAHRQLRIRHENQSALVHFETSDGTVWVDRLTVAAKIAVDATAAKLYAGTYGAPAPQSLVRFDNFVISGRCPSM